jgi:hypothetical protein
MWRALRRGRAEAGSVFLAAVAATLVAAVLLGKVLSPQYMVWLLPTVLLVPGRRGRIAVATLVAALPLTQLVFPVLFESFVDRGADLPVRLLFARNMLLALMLLAVWPRSAEGTGTLATPQPAPSPAGERNARGEHRRTRVPQPFDPPVPRGAHVGLQRWSGRPGKE